MCEKIWQLTWVLELEAEWEVEDGSKYKRLHAVAEEEVVVGSPVQVG